MVDETQPHPGDDTADGWADGSRWAPGRSDDDVETSYIDDLPAPSAPAPEAPTTVETSEAPVALRARRRPRLSVPRPTLSGLRSARPSIGRMSLDPRASAALVGALVGATLLLLTVIGLQGCQLITGTSSCGTGPGFVGLLVIFALAVVAGRALLSFFSLPDPGSTSFLGVALTSVVALLFLIDVLDSPVMIVVIPVVTAVTYVFSWWLTTRFVEAANDDHR